MIVASGVFIIPFTPILLIQKPSLESLFVVLLLVGLWPMCAAASHGAFLIEHFISRSISKDVAEKYDLIRGGHWMYATLTLSSGDYLSKALAEYGPILDTKTILRGTKLVNRHRAIARFVWPGMTIAAIGGIGLAMLQVLGVPAAG